MEPELSWNWSPGHELAPGLLAWALLGDGRRCETWPAWDLGRWCPVAVKLPRPGSSARAVAALAQEAQVAGPVAHPGIRRLLESRLDQPLPHLVFEYVEGPTLDDALADDGPFHPVDVLLTGMQLAAALGHLHGRGLAHLDVKPGNVVLREGRPVLIDLGLLGQGGHRPLLLTGPGQLHRHRAPAAQVPGQPGLAAAAVAEQRPGQQPRGQLVAGRPVPGQLGFHHDAPCPRRGAAASTAPRQRDAGSAAGAGPRACAGPRPGHRRGAVTTVVREHLVAASDATTASTSSAHELTPSPELPVNESSLGCWRAQSRA